MYTEAIKLPGIQKWEEHTQNTSLLLEKITLIMVSNEQNRKDK